MSSTINASVDGIVLTASSTAAMDLATGGTNRLSIDTSGNVGIATGNLTFSGTGQRITGDMSNATIANRLAFQTSTTNSATRLMAIPNGTSTVTAFNVLNSSDPNNASWLSVGVSSIEAAINATISGTGTYLPMTFYTGGSERMRLDTSGNVNIGASSNYGGLLSVARAQSGGIANLLTLYDASSGAEINFQTYSDPTFGTATRFSFGGAYLAIRNGTTERMRIDSSGNVSIGGTAGFAGTRINLVGGFSTSGGFTLGFDANGQIPSGTTDSYYGYRSAPTTQAASFTLTNMQHFRAQANTIGAGSAVTNQVGFYAASDLTGATNNYGFYSAIASGSNRWNFYAGGTADNYFAGNVGIGTTSPVVKLQSAGTSGSAQFRAGTASNGYFEINAFDSSPVYCVVAGANATAGVFGTQSNIPTIFFSNNTERMRITSGGEVYIAGTTDQGAYNLQCNGTGVWGAGAYVNGSDARLKDNIQSLDSGLDVVKAMRPVTFQYKPEYSKDQNVQPGFIAQELQQAMAGKNYLDGVVQSGPEYLNVAYQNIIPILVKAIQELEAKVAALETK